MLFDGKHDRLITGIKIILKPVYMDVGDPM